jgi:hypothetical protein
MQNDKLLTIQELVEKLIEDVKKLQMTNGRMSAPSFAKHSYRNRRRSRGSIDTYRSACGDCPPHEALRIHARHVQR